MTTRHKAFAALLLVSILWGTAGSVGKLLLREGHPFVIILYRFGAAALLMLPFFLAAKKPKRWFTQLLPLGLFNGSNVLLYFLGLTHTTANTGSLLGTGVPILTALLSWLLIKETLSKAKLLGIIIGLIGSALIVLVPILDRGQSIGTSLMGNLFMIGSCIAWALYIIRARSSAGFGSFNPVVATFVNFATCTIMALIASLATGQSLALPALISPSYGVLFAYSVVGVTIITFFLFQWALQHVSATTASLKDYVQLIIGVSVNAIVLGEQLTPAFIFGSILILTGVLMATSQHFSKKILSLWESRTA